MKIIKNTIYNLIGLGTPLLIAIYSIPVLISVLGDDKFGVLTLIWAIVSYLGLLDLGLGRALTLQLAPMIKNRDVDSVSQSIFAATITLLSLGCIILIVMLLLGNYIGVILDGAGSLTAKNDIIFWVAISMPAILVTSGLKGILEANGNFAVLNMIRLPMGVYTFIAPLLVANFFGPDLVLITKALVIGRYLAMLVHIYAVIKLIEFNCSVLKFKLNMIVSLLSSGGWMTVSNIVSPFMGYLDRFVIASLISSAAVAYYVTPQEIITKLWIIPGAVTTVLFPAFAAELSQRSNKVVNMYYNGISGIFIILLPICSFLYLFSYDLLKFWIDKDFAKESYIILMIFSFGIMINCLAHIPYTLLQSYGKSKITAKIHLIELPLYMILIYIMANNFGLYGVAISWLIRNIFDTLLMFLFSLKYLGEHSFPFKDRISITILSLSLLGWFVSAFCYDLEVYTRLMLLASICMLSTFSLIFIYSKNKK